MINNIGIKILSNRKELRNLLDLERTKDLRIETEKDGNKKLIFRYPIDKELNEPLQLEGYLRTSLDEFVIKQKNKMSNYYQYTAYLNLEELEGKEWPNFETIEMTIDAALTLALVGTGWTIGKCDVTKKRTLRKSICSTKDIIDQAVKTYRCYIEYDTILKQINIYEKLGADLGAYFHNELNLKELSSQYNTLNYYTRIIAYGKSDEDGKELKVTLEINDPPKIKTFIWKDERYTDIESLAEDAQYKLDELSRVYKSYVVEIRDLAKKYDEYRFLKCRIGDIVTLVDTETGTKDKQMITKLVEYLIEPDRNTVQIANTFLDFADIQKEYSETIKTVSNITSDNGTVSESAIKDVVDKLTVKKLDVSIFSAAEARIGQLETNKLSSEEAYIKFAQIDKAVMDKADITDLTAVNIKFGVASGGTLDLQTLLSNFIAGENGQLVNLTSKNAVLDEALIRNGIAAKMQIGDLQAGTISTNKFTIASTDGGLNIVGPTIQWKDKNNKIRMQAGKDAQGNFTFLLVGEDGTTALLDQTGIKKGAIANDLIVSDMISENAIGEKQINYSSLITGLNKDDNTSLIKASKVAIDLTGQSLEVAFNSLKSNVDNMEIGGRNLILNSSKCNISSISKASKNLELKKDIVEYLNNHIGENVIASCNVDVTNIKTATGDYGLRMGMQISVRYIDDTTGFIQAWYAGSVGSSKKGRIKGKPVKIKKEIKAISGGIYIQVTSDECMVSYPKFELGDKATDWTPAPEDVDQVTQSLQTQITVAQGKIEGLIKDTTITEGSSSTSLKDAYISLKATVNGLNSTVASHTSSISTVTTELGKVDGKINTAKADAISTAGADATSKANNALSSAKSYTNAQITTVNTRVSNAESSITQLNNSITNKVWQSDIDKTITEINSRGENLVTNGNGSYKDNTNFSGWTYAGDVRGISGLPSFDKGKDYLSVSDDMIYVDISRDYRFGYELKAKEETTSLVYGLIQSFDIDGKNIGPVNVMYIENTLTELAKDLKAGDTVVYFKDLANWEAISSTPDYKRGFIFWDYADSTGYIYPPETYSRNVTSNLYADSSKVNKTAKTITLAKPWTGRTVPTGTKVSQCSSGSTYIYLGISGKPPSTDFVRYDVPVRSHVFRPGTVSIKVGIMGSVKLYMSNIYFGLDKVSSSDLSLVSTEVTTVKEKAATLETNLNGITSKVTNLESTTSTINGKVNSQEIRLQSTEQKVTATGVITTITEAINAGTNSLTTMQFILDKNGATIKNGALRILNKTGKTVLSGDSDGNLTMTGDYVNLKDTGITALKIVDTTIKFYNWEVEGQELGMIYSSKIIGDNNKKGIGIGHNVKSYVHIGGKNESTGAYTSYIAFDKFNVLGRSASQYYDSEIIVNGPTFFSGQVRLQRPIVVDNPFGCLRMTQSYLYGDGTIGKLLTSQTTASSGQMYGDVALLGRRGSNPNPNAYCVMGQLLSNSEYSYERTLVVSSSGVEINGNLRVTGTKNRLIETQSFGDLCLNAYETTGSWFGDLGRGIIDNTGACYIYFDPKFIEVVNTNFDYNVFLQKYGQGDLWVEDRQHDYFVVKGTPNLEFAWEAKCKQRGYETDRLEETYEKCRAVNYIDVIPEEDESYLDGLKI